MAQERLSVFGDTGDLDLSTFEPEQKSRMLKPAREKVRAVTEAASFPSREGRAPAAEVASEAVVSDPPKRKPRYHTTGRTAQLNCRVMPAIHNRIYAIADQQGWLVGETIEQAVAALERELEEAGQGKRAS
jgi:hypothetical protein